MSVRWEVTVQTSPDDILTGPMTWTNAANSVTLRGRGILSGNDSRGYEIHLSVESSTGDNPAFPTCTIFGNPPTRQGDPFPRPYNRITATAFTVRFNSCNGFVEYPSGIQGTLQETAQLTLTK